MASKFGRHYPVLGKTNERERLLFVAAAGLAFSLLVILMVVFTFKSKVTSTGDVPEAPVKHAIGTVTLLTPERYVKSGTKLSNVGLKEVYWPRNNLPEGAVRDLAELSNMFAKVDIPAGVPLQRQHLTAEQSMASLPLTPGNRAVTIEVDAISSIAEHALPGTHVDVALTYYEGDDLTTKIIVQNARVLSLGGDSTPGHERRFRANNSRRPGSSKTITLDVAPKDALQIQTAKRLGNLSLMMRAPEDNDPIPVQEFGQKNLSNPAKEKKRSVCKRGSLRIEGQEYVINCDGTKTRVSDPFEP